jgi:hypothetical protein
MTRRLAPALLVLALLTACAENDLKRVAEALAITAKSLAVVQDTVLQANKSGLIADEEKNTILGVCLKINLAGKEATALTRDLAKLEKPQKAELIAILLPVVKALDNAIAKDVLGIKDPKTQATVRVSLQSIQTALNTVMIIIGAR